MNTLISYRVALHYDRIHCLLQFKFIVEEDVALPVDSAFWGYLMASSQIQWSLIVYEQDWLDVQCPNTKALHVSQHHKLKHRLTYNKFADHS